MALPVLRGCYRVPSTLRLSRLFLNDSIVLHRSGKTRQPRLSAVAEAVRPYSSDRGKQKRKQEVVVVSIQNPLIWFRAKVHLFLIRTFIDKEFTIEEFTKGAKQAFSYVSRLLSQCQFEALDGLVSKDLIGKLEEKCNLLSSNYKKALYADPDEIITTSTGEIGLLYGDDGSLYQINPLDVTLEQQLSDQNKREAYVTMIDSYNQCQEFIFPGRKFVSVVIRFWYMTSAQFPDDNVEAPHIFKMVIGEGELENKRMLTAIYEFQREFTEGVPPEWTITRIEHSKLLE